MGKTASGGDHSRMPPVLNIIALATFAASLSARALDPVLPHVASDFSVSIATAAGFASVFAFTFAIIQPALGAAADLFGKARLVIICLVLLGVANVLGALSSSFPMLFATRILAGIGAGGVFPIALGLTSDLVGPEKRQIAIGRTLAGSMTGNLLGASLSGLIGDFLGWRGVLAVLGSLAVVASIAVALGFRNGALTRAAGEGRSVGAQTRLSHHLRQSKREGLLQRGIRRGLLRARPVSLRRLVPVRAGRHQPVDRRAGDRRLRRRWAALHPDGVALAAADRRQRDDDLGRGADGPATRNHRLRSALADSGFNFLLMGWGFYMIHGSLQVFASELSVEARATALSLHSFFFFMGQTIGPIAYGFGILNAGKIPTLLSSALIIVVLGLVCARLLRQTRPADVGAA